MNNLVTCCQPCNIIKGKRQFASFEGAKEYVLKMRDEWRQLYEQQVKSSQHSAASVH